LSPFLSKFEDLKGRVNRVVQEDCDVASTPCDKVARLHHHPAPSAAMDLDSAKQRHPQFVLVMKAIKLQDPKPEWYRDRVPDLNLAL
jgi:hypothetical protein